MPKQVFLFGLILLSSSLFAQDDLLKMLEEEAASEPTTEYATATFKSTRIINSQSVENLSEGTLDFRILHRFGYVNTGIYELFGLDRASMRMSFDYGIKDWLTVGVGRSTFEKQYDGFIKAKILRQSKGKRNMPITLNYIAGTMIKSLKWTDPERENYFSSRLYYLHQITIGRKFNQNFSLQIMPTLLHHNLVANVGDPNDLFSVGVGGRIKLNKRVSLNVEYFYQINKLPGTVNPLSIGFDIETGGHVFQLHFTNAIGMTERSFITENKGRWDKGDIMFGFNLSRSFTLKDNRKIKKKD